MFFNSSEIVNALISNKVSGDLLNGINIIIVILKAIGIVFLIYIIFLIIRSISDLIRNRRIKKMYEKIEEMDEKLDIILNRGKIRDKYLKNNRNNIKKDKRGLFGQMNVN